MKKFNSSYKDGKYEEAERYALLAKEVDPDNPIPGGGFQIAHKACYSGYHRYCIDRDGSSWPGVAGESPAPGGLTVMPRPVTTDAPTTCPYLERPGRNLVRWLAPMSISKIAYWPISRN